MSAEPKIVQADISDALESARDCFDRARDVLQGDPPYTKEQLDDLRAAVTEAEHLTNKQTREHNFYWLPFPGTYQCVINDGYGQELASGMGGTKPAAREAADKNLTE